MPLVPPLGPPDPAELSSGAEVLTAGDVQSRTWAARAELCFPGKRQRQQAALEFHYP